MRAAQVKDGAVINIIEVLSLSDIAGVIDAKDCNIGDGWNGIEFIKKIIIDKNVPFVIPMWKARQILISDNLIDKVNAAIALIPDETQKKLAQSKFEYSVAMQRDDQLISFVANAIGLSDNQVDDLFIRANNI